MLGTRLVTAIDPDHGAVMQPAVLLGPGHRLAVCRIDQKRIGLLSLSLPHELQARVTTLRKHDNTIDQTTFGGLEADDKDLQCIDLVVRSSSVCR